MRGKCNTEGPFDLKALFGRKYRVTYEPSYYAAYGPRAKREDPWLMILVCRYGHIFPWSEDRLAASVDGHPIVAGKLRRLKCCRVVQDGDFGELTATFELADFSKVARIMRPRRRRELTAAERAELVGRLRAARRSGPDPPTQGERTGRARVLTARVDSSPVDRQTALFV